MNSALALLVLSAAAALGFDAIYKDYKNHECNRDCSQGSPKQCHYEITLELALTNQMDCLDCLNGIYEDCFNVNCLPTDGTQRLVNVFNRMLPGPTIEVCQGDEIVVDFKNNLLTETSSIHWHGMHQRQTPYMDGVPLVTQCPVQPLTKFRYHFTANETGTHWYHSHSGFQRMDGAYGALIVHEAKPFHKKLYDHDLPENIMIVTEWFRDSPVMEYMQEVRQFAEGEDFLAGILINGLVSSKSTKVPQKRFHVQPNSRYRFRVIVASAFICPMEMTIEGHILQVISTDGYDIQPISANSITMTGGERYDIVVETNQPIGTYAIKLFAHVCNFTSIAALIYEGSETSRILYNKPIDYNETIKVNGFRMPNNAKNVISFNQMKSVVPLDDRLKGKPDLQYYVVLEMVNYVRPSYRAVGYENGLTLDINGIIMTAPIEPLLLNLNQERICNSGNKTVCDPSLRLCECLHLQELPSDKMIELIIVSKGTPMNVPHPMHLHGYNFRVVAHDRIADNVTAEFIKELDLAGKISPNVDAPPIKDTVPVNDGGYAVIRFISDNPGIWFMHCHIDFHQQDGMQMAFKTGDYTGPFPDGFPTCGNFPRDRKENFIP